MKKKLLSFVLTALLLGGSISTVKTFAQETTNAPAENTTIENTADENSDGEVKNENDEPQNTSDEKEENTDNNDPKAEKVIKTETVTIKELFDRFPTATMDLSIFGKKNENNYDETKSILIFWRNSVDLRTMPQSSLDKLNEFKIILNHEYDPNTNDTTTYGHFDLNHKFIVLDKYIILNSTNFVYGPKSHVATNIPNGSFIIPSGVTLQTIDTSDLTKEELRLLLEDFANVGDISRDEIDTYMAKLSSSNLDNENPKKSKSPNTADVSDIGLLTILALSSLATMRFAYKK